MSAKIHALPSAALPDVAGMLRNMADNIDAGKYGAANGAVVVLHASSLEVFGLGEADGVVSHYLLGCAMQKLQAPTLDRK
jgi:hypothetical protein